MNNINQVKNTTTTELNTTQTNFHLNVSIVPVQI